ncbi:MAG TPA: hypothetical protein VGV68_03605 [Terriglobia bacterium]|nr:hypothetical protein [Terriglobia bacterium]
MNLDRDFTERARRVFRDEDDLLAVILRAHLVLEHCLEIRLRRIFKLPDVLNGRRFGRLGFAQKAAVFVGLTHPSNKCQDLLLGFNKLRNRAAHIEGSDLNQATQKILSTSIVLDPDEDFDPDATVKWAFFMALRELDLADQILEEKHKGVRLR